MAVIELPAWAIPNGADAALIDFGGTLRPALGGPLLRINRQGSRYRATLTFPPFTDQQQGRIVVSRLIRAKQRGLRVPFPLTCPQPFSDGLVDGAGQAGMTVRLRGLTPRAAIREGYWISLVRADGQHYLHNVGGEVVVDASGRASVPLSEMLRFPFADGSTAKLVRPMIEGLIDGSEQAWRMSVESYVGIEITVEEAA